MRHDIVRRAGNDEPRFELPPRLRTEPERRLTLQAASARAGGSDGHEFRNNRVVLAAGAAGEVVVVAVGGLVEAAFGLPPGLLDAEPDTLGGVLAAAFALSLADRAVRTLEAAVATPGAACVLLRGILLPTAAGAEVLLSWKEVLGADATALLRAELLREMAAARPRTQRVDAFA